MSDAAREMAERIVDVVDAMRDPFHPARREPGMALIIEKADHRFIQLYWKGGPSNARRTAIAEAVDALRREFPEPEAPSAAPGR